MTKQDLYVMSILFLFIAGVLADMGAVCTSLALLFCAFIAINERKKLE